MKDKIRNAYPTAQSIVPGLVKTSNLSVSSCCLAFFFFQLRHRVRERERRSIMGILKTPHFQDLTRNLHSNLSEVWISAINSSRNGRTLFVKLWNKKKIHSN